MLVMPDPGRFPGKSDVLFEVSAIFCPEQIRLQFRAKDDAPETEAGFFRLFVQSDDMRRQGFVVDGQILVLSMTVELDAVAVLVKRIGGKNRRFPIRVDDRGHEVDGEPVAVRFVRFEFPAFLKSGLGILVYLGRFLFLQSLIGINHNLSYCRVNIGAAQKACQIAVADKVFAAGRQPDATLQMTVGCRAEASALCGNGNHRGEKDEQRNPRQKQIPDQPVRIHIFSPAN